MKRLAFLIGAIVAPCIASAACEQYEYGELKAMKKNDLEFAYCVSVLESRKAQIHADTADKLESLNNERYAPDPSVSARNGRAAEQASTDGSQCEASISKIARQIEARHMSVAKVRAGCNLD